MNDRFKFRVWDKRLNRYLGKDDPTQMITDDGYLAYLDDDGMKHYIIEQCTGLKDKNGNLIYEGDIVREISKKEPEWEEYIIAVEWKDCGFNLYSSEDFDFDIIGNIHENKELLEW